MDLARTHDAALHAVHVAPPRPQRGWWSRHDDAEALYEAQLAARREELDRLLATAAGLTTSAEVRTGVPHVEVVREALRVRADLVVVAESPGHRPRGFGTVTMKLMRFCPVPVLAWRTGLKANRSVLAAVDLSTHSEEETRLNSRIVELASLLARQTSTSMVVFHAWELWGEQWLRGRGRAGHHDVDAIADEAHTALAEALQGLTESATVARGVPRALLRKGEPHKLLPAVILEQKAGLVVMGTVGRGILEGMLMGNTAERILNELTTSVLAVKPAGFRSPIDESD